jgi:hypothetical protein
MKPISARPVLAEIDTSPTGLAALRIAAGEAAERELPLRLFLSRPSTIWTNPIAMPPHRGHAAASDDTIKQAKTVVANLRTTHPTLSVSATVVHDASSALRRASAGASLLVEVAGQHRPGIFGRNRRLAAARCPVLQVGDTAAA